MKRENRKSNQTVQRTGSSRFAQRQIERHRQLAPVADLCVQQFDNHNREEYNRSMRQILIYPGEDGCWVAECPSLPGCVSQGATREDAVRNIKEAIEGYVLALQEDGIRVPEDCFEAMLVAV